MTRAMFVTVLWRMAGSPEPEGTATFEDLTADWYKKAVNWAYENEIVTGYSSTVFDPNREITREQYVSLTKDKRIASVGICDAEEKITGVRLLNDKEDRFRTGNIDHVDKNYLSMRVISD